MWRWLRPTSSRRDADAAGLRAELELVLEENLRLRLEQQRALDAARGQERIAALRPAATSADEADDADDVWHTLAEVRALRQSLLAACKELALTIAAVETRVSGAPAPQELDRRVLSDRRRDEPAPVSNDRRSGSLSRGHGLRAAR